LYSAGSSTAAIRSIWSTAAPTLTATNASVTYTDAATWYIGGAPTASTNVTITNTPWSLWVDAGPARFDDGIYSGTTAGCTGTPTVATGGIATTCTEPVPDPLTQTEVNELRGLLMQMRGTK